MKVIDLLNKIANGEELPKEIRYKGVYWYLEQKFSNELPYYKNGYDDDNLLTNEEEYYFSRSLNDEVEIIEEEKKIEHIDLSERIGETYCISPQAEKIQNTINKIIDKLNKE